MIKKITSLVLALTLVMSLSLCLFACDNDKEGDGTGEGGDAEKTTYTVTVVDDSGNPIPGARVIFSPEGGTAIPFPTDAEGKATFKTDKEISVAVSEIPAGYSYDKMNLAQVMSSESLTITITKLAPMVIKVVDENGAPLSGVTVQMCDSEGSCRIPVTTKDDGTASYPYEEGDFHAQLTVVPDGYTVEDPSAYYDFVDGVATIVVTKITE